MKAAKFCKSLGLEKEAFGPQAHIQLQPANTEPNNLIKANWTKMVRNSGALVRSLGSMAVPGLEEPDYMVRIELEDDENGPRNSPGSMSMRMFLMQHRINGRRWITAVGPNVGDGEMTVWFNGVNIHTIETAKQMQDCPASYTYIYLRKRGWT